MITLKKIKEKHLKDLYKIIYSSENPEWSKYNAPYFNEYKYIDLDTFLLKKHHEYFLSERVLGIFLNEKPRLYTKSGAWKNSIPGFQFLYTKRQISNIIKVYKNN